MSEAFVDHADPDEVFGALADDTRIDILQALWDADGPLAFSALRAAAGVRDSGKFNYHLDTLVDQFVAKTEDGYRLTQAGKGIVGAIAAGTYTMEGSIEPIELDESCPTCGGTRTLHYEDEAVRVDCDGCTVTFGGPVPPAALADYDREAIPGVASRFLKTTFRHLAEGFCWYCTGRVEPTVGPVREVMEGVDEVADEDESDVDERRADVPMVRFDCQHCGATSTTGLDHVFVDHPTVAGFFHDHGVDVRTLPVWDYPPIDPDRLQLVARDPLRVRVTYRADGDTLTIVADGDLDVVDVES